MTDPDMKICDRCGAGEAKIDLTLTIEKTRTPYHAPEMSLKIAEHKISICMKCSYEDRLMNFVREAQTWSDES